MIKPWTVLKRAPGNGGEILTVRMSKLVVLSHSQSYTDTVTIPVSVYDDEDEDTKIFEICERMGYTE